MSLKALAETYTRTPLHSSSISIIDTARRCARGNFGLWLANPFEIFLALVDAGLSYDNLAARASPVDADQRLSATKAKKNLFLTSVYILSLRHLARFSHIFAHVF